MESKQPITIGVDVSKKTLDAALLLTDDSYIAKSFSNDASGIKQLLSWVAKHGGQRCPIGVEATGGLEQALCNLGYKAKHPIQKVMPTRIVNYRKSLTLRNKTDYDDARLIAQFIKVMPTTDWQPLSPSVQLLQDLLKRRRMAVQMYTMMENSMNTLQTANQQSKARTDLRHFKRCIEKIEAEIERTIASDAELVKHQELLRSIPGVGPQTATILCAFIDISKFKSAKQLSAFVGIAPMRKQSGNHECKARISKIGDARVRSALYMAALSARRHNPIIRDFGDHLQHRRTDYTKKQVIVACAHKLIRIVYGVLKHNNPFNPDYVCEVAA